MTTRAAKTTARRPAAAPEAYYSLPAFSEATGGKSPRKTIRFSPYELAEKHGMNPDDDPGASDIVTSWNFDDPVWKEARTVEVPRRLRVLVPFGKYARDPHHGFEIHDYEAPRGKSTLLPLLRFCTDRFFDHIEEHLDGSFFEGLELYPNGLWVFSMNA